MIIFNIYSFIIFVLVFITTYILSFINIETGKLGNPYFWLLILLFSGIAEIFKLRSRIYFFPLWLISLILAVILSVNKFTGLEMYAHLSIILVLLISGIIIMNIISKKRWNNAVDSLIKLKNNITETNSGIWDGIKTSFYVPEYLYPNSGFQYILLGRIYKPIYLKWVSKKEVNNHFIEVCKLIKPKVTEYEYKRYVSLFESKLYKIQKGEKTYFEQHMFEYILTLIDKYRKTN